MQTIGTWWMWVGFAAFVVVAIAIDLLVMEKQGAHKVTMKEAAIWSAFWFGLSFIFAGLLFGREKSIHRQCLCVFDDI